MRPRLTPEKRAEIAAWVAERREFRRRYMLKTGAKVLGISKTTLVRWSRQVGA